MKILQRLFRGKSARNDEFGALDEETAAKVIGDYARFLETSAPPPGRIADTSELPHSKNLIKDALRLLINGTDDAELIGHLKNGYLMLSAWQAGVGEQTVGVDFTSLNLEADPMEIAQKIQCQNSGMDRWKPLIREEQSALAGELRTLGVSC